MQLSDFGIRSGVPGGRHGLSSWGIPARLDPICFVDAEDEGEGDGGEPAPKSGDDEKSEIERLRAQNQKLLKEKKSISSKLQSYQDAETEAERKRQEEAGEFDKLKQTLTSERDEALSEVNAMARDSALERGLREAGIDPDFSDAVSALLREKVKVEKGDDGRRVATIEGQSVSDFLKKWTETDGKRFVASKSNGSGAPGGGAGAPTSGKVDGSRQERAAYFREKYNLPN